MSRALQILVALLIALGGGAMSAAWTIANWPRIAGIAQGPWISMPNLGRAEADPYSLSFQQSDVRLPLGASEGNMHHASTDSEGRPLDPACTYAITGTPPLAQLFTLRAETPDGKMIAPPAPLPGFLASDAMVFSASGFRVTVGPDASPGNWLALRTTGPFVLVLTLYDVAVGNDNVGSGVILPDITKVACGNA